MKRCACILLVCLLAALAPGARAQQRADVAFTVQYYALLDRFAPDGGTELTVMDTSGGVLPENSSLPPTRNVYLDPSTGRVITRKQLQKLYRTQSFRFYDAPGVAYVDQVTPANGNYRLSQLWVWKGTGSADGVDPAHWQVYDSPAHLRFTNEEGLEDAVLITPDAVLRLVYEPTADEYRTGVTFYDYDITDGQAYADAAYTTPAQRGEGTLYVKTAREGINSTANTSGGTGAVLAFGNRNTGGDLASEQWGGQYINRFNTGAFSGCAFGLVTGVDAQGRVVFADGVNAPSLFGPDAAAGKTVIGGWQLGFARSGDTYTLSSVRRGDEAVLQQLDRFSNPDARYPHIFSNHFWPMDSAPTWNQPGHDVAFGRRDLREQRRYGTGAYQLLPEADDGLDHNSYFGMSYAVAFTLSPDYAGPLEYMFFGDDDMWAFLDGRLICDIGGVHSSVGQYVDLWDYITPSNADQQHTLQFFYTERGASGSTCYMAFTLPSVNRQTQLAQTGALAVEKTVRHAGDAADSFTFTVVLNDASIHGRYGQMVFERGRAAFTLRHGERMTAEGLPQGVGYTVTETAADGYTADVTGSVGQIVPQATQVASFVNTRVTPAPPTASPTPSAAPSPTPAPSAPPATSTPSPVPKTGDAAPLGLWAGLAAVALLGLGYAARLRRKP